MFDKVWGKGHKCSKTRPIVCMFSSLHRSFKMCNLLFFSSNWGREERAVILKQQKPIPASPNLLFKMIFSVVNVLHKTGQKEGESKSW